MSLLGCLAVRCCLTLRRDTHPDGPGVWSRPLSSQVPSEASEQAPKPCSVLVALESRKPCVMFIILARAAMAGYAKYTAGSEVLLRIHGFAVSAKSSAVRQSYIYSLGKPHLRGMPDRL